ncbi:hypothetical protein NL676_011317 [Syzygium grande]|nr:hypothetical protein NL676_011317 [Syzygium grande]
MADDRSRLFLGSRTGPLLLLLLLLLRFPANLAGGRSARAQRVTRGRASKARFLPAALPSLWLLAHRFLVLGASGGDPLIVGSCS